MRKRSKQRAESEREMVEALGVNLAGHFLRCPG